MTILLTGGGTGGHITPILAVAHEIKRQNPRARIIYVGERNGKYRAMVQGNSDIDQSLSIFAGKFRRYHGESWLRRLLDLKTLWLNTRDLVFVIVGFFQSLWLVKKHNPNVVFLKGGFVGVPIGLAAAVWHKSIVTHDSDAVPGLANRLVGRWAKIHATAMPDNYYSYPKDSQIHVGVLVGRQYEFVSDKMQKAYRKQLDIKTDNKVLMITGGSGGAQAINEAVAGIMPKLLADIPELSVIHQVGIGKQAVYGDFRHDRLQVYELLTDMQLYSGAADLIISRAGANTIAEFGIQGKACIVIPNPLLTAGHQLKNAEYLEEQGAAIIVSEELMSTQPAKFQEIITELLNNPQRQRRYGKRLTEITIKDAATRLAEIILKV